MDRLLDNLPLVIGTLTAAIALIKKSYGLERDIKHLQRNLPQLSSGVALELKELEERLDAAERRLDIAEAREGLTERVLAILEKQQRFQIFESSIKGYGSTTC